MLGPLNNPEGCKVVGDSGSHGSLLSWMQGICEAKERPPCQQDVSTKTRDGALPSTLFSSPWPLGASSYVPSLYFFVHFLDSSPHTGVSPLSTLSVIL